MAAAAAVASTLQISLVSEGGSYCIFAGAMHVCLIGLAAAADLAVCALLLAGRLPLELVPRWTHRCWRRCAGRRL